MEKERVSEADTNASTISCGEDEFLSEDESEEEKEEGRANKINDRKSKRQAGELWIKDEQTRTGRSKRKHGPKLETYTGHLSDCTGRNGRRRGKTAGGTSTVWRQKGETYQSPAWS